MRIFNYIVALCLIVLAFVACEKEEDPAQGTVDYLVFGHFYGECGGEGCVELFRLEEDRLLEDTADVYPTLEGFAPQFDIQIEDGKFQAVKDLVDFFPDTLKMDPDTIIGIPDGGDWGGIYVELKSGSFHRYWFLDQNENNMPQVYNDFVDRINEKIAIINQ